MRKEIKKIVKLMTIVCFVGLMMTACGGEDQEIFDNVEIEDEKVTQEPKEKIQKPK